MTQENEYVKQRQEKVTQLRQKGVNPYPNNIRPKDHCGELYKRFESWDAEKLAQNEEIYSLAGRVMARRSFGKAGFLQLRDLSGDFQIFCQKDLLSSEEYELYKDLDIGDFIFIEGQLFRTKTNELTLKASCFKVVTKSIQPLPEKWHGLTDVELRYRQRYVDLIANPKVKEVFIKRSEIINEIRQFLVKKGFLEVETPMMHPIPGGAAAKPFQTYHHTLDMDLFLRIAPELYLKRLVVGGLEKVFEINRNFRNEGISIQHNPEFTMLEFYWSYATYEDLITLTEEMFAHVIQKTNHGNSELEYQGEKISFKSPFKYLTLKDALVEIGGLEKDRVGERVYLEEKIKKCGLEGKIGSGGIGVLQTFLFEALVEHKLIQPTFITQFPTEVSPLARRNDENPEVTDRFELYIYGREIANAFSELNDPADQKERFLNQVKARETGDEEAMYYDKDYICALEYGMPPTAGEGIGIDRLVMLLTNSASIRDVILFPQLRPEK